MDMLKKWFKGLTKEVEAVEPKVVDDDGNLKLIDWKSQEVEIDSLTNYQELSLENIKEELRC